MGIRPQVTTQISKSFLVEYTELIEELDGGGRKKILIKDWEYFKDKLSMCQMALFLMHKKKGLKNITRFLWSLDSRTRILSLELR